MVGCSPRYVLSDSVGRPSLFRLALVLPVMILAGCGSPNQRAQEYYEKGMAFIEKNDDLKARVELLSAVKYNADKVEVWRALAGIDERTKASSLFLDLRRVVELDPADLGARIRLARLMVDGGAGDAALKVIEAANESQPNADLHALKAVILARTKDISGAVREAQRALEIDPKNVDAVMVISAKKLSDGDADGALQLLNATPPDPKTETQILLLKMQAFARKNDLPQAETLLRQLVAKNPQQPAYRNQLVQFYIAGRQFDQAEQELRGIADANPTDSKARLDLIRYLISVKGAAAGQQELAARIKAGGEIFDYQVAQAELDFAQGRFDEATEQLKRFVDTETSPERKLTAQTKLAEMYVTKANFSAAEPLIADILRKDRRNTAGLRLRAAIRIEQGQIDSAVTDLREALSNQPKAADLLLLMAAAYERGGKHELAERQYADAFKASELNPNVALRYVAFLQRKGDLAHAEEVLAQAIGRNSQDLSLLTTLARVRLVRKNWPGALAVADVIGKIGDNLGQAEQIRAAAFAGQNKIDESIAALERAHAIAPDAVQPVASLVSTYQRVGKTDKAEALMREIAKKFPDNAEILVLIGNTKLAQNKVDEALQSYKLAIAKQPKNPNGYNALSDLYTRQKNYDSAIDVIQAGLKEQPANVDFRLQAAGLQVLKGDPAAAISQYESILKDQPNSVIAANNLVSLILETRSDKQSLERAFEFAEKLKFSDVPEFQDTYGWSQFKRGDAKNAVATLETAAAKLPNLAAVRYHLAMSYAAAGQNANARENFKAAWALEPDGTALKEAIRAAMK